MVEPIFISPYFLDYILPFVLVFTLIFAILEKTKLLGEGKRQVDAIVGLVVGLILIAFPFPRTIVVELMPFLAVAAIILLVFMLLYGFIAGKKEGDVLNPYLKVALGIILVFALITVLLIIADWWDPVYEFLFERETASQVWINVLLLVVLAGAVLAVLKGGKESSSGGE